MIGLRAVLFAWVAVADRRAIADALHGQLSVASAIVFAILGGLATYVILDLWKRYA
jgi:hypothetical protein